jgi:hypothetical protein
MVDPSRRHSDKICAACGRKMSWRKVWARNWEQMRFCSEGCRRWRGTRHLDQELESAIQDLLVARGRGVTICPSEAARAVRAEGWREIMERTRCAARRLAARGTVEMVQRGRRVDPSSARGRVRLRGTKRLHAGDASGERGASEPS